MATFKGNYDGRLIRGARAAVNDVLAAKRDEKILIITNPEQEVREISMSVYDAALEVGARPVLMFQKRKTQFDLAEDSVIKAIESEPDVAISISDEKLGKDRWGLKKPYKGTKRSYSHIFDMLYEEKRFRAFWSPGITRDMWARTVPIDYSQLRSDVAKVISMLSKCDQVTVTAPGGTCVTIDIKGRKHRPDDGDVSKPGKTANLPSGEVYSSPVVEKTNGVIAFDGSIALAEKEILIKKPIVCGVTDGHIVDISGGKDADLLHESIKMGETRARKMGRAGELTPKSAASYARNASHIGELGIGLNRKAKIVANVLEDEKVYGTCHFAVGSNYDGDADALIHMDGLVKRPTIIAMQRSGKEHRIMVDGKLVWD